ncbi:peptide ABC transporter substrate-binding protein [Ktedonosporobacter rubrisoli]|uniref:Peptide ABC transporter substrate-binding protein n=1 Tax=Ktedonosporobacter rubrisoli TaxID=2509675 RepID=A0A4P6JIB0_KTERU|nr:peptide ABC transporter substrate-binding protein [Ktedonosporobacter rubrisoli]QBD74794.1 peptide ABC transporter substrate-binding protein [Ktedonosporobacter rubrisoli]
MSIRRGLTGRFGFIGLVMLTLLLAACGGGTPQTNSSNNNGMSNNQTLIYSTQGQLDVTDFDPAYSGGPIGPNFYFTGLVELNEKNELIDQLAQSHELASDGVTWTFHLKPNLTFSDGSPLTSEDVIYCIERALKPETKSGNGPAYLGAIKDAIKLNSGKIKTIIGDSLLAPDPRTVVIVTEQKAAYFLQTLTYNTSFTVSKKYAEKYGNKLSDHLTDPIAAGPFVISQVQDQKIIFTPNEHYYGPKPKLKKIIMAFYPDVDASYKAYLVGQVSLAKVPSVQRQSAKALPGNQYHQTPILGTSYYTMNYLTKPFDNIKIRQAFALAINKDQVAKSVFNDTVVPTNHIIPSGMPGYNPDLKGPSGISNTSGDPEMAKKLFDEGLKEEGLTRQSLPPLTLTIYNVSADDGREASVVQQMWQQVLGVSVKVDSMESNAYRKAVDATAHNPKGLIMWGAYWKADYPDPQNWMSTLFDKDAYFNSENYSVNQSSNVADQQKAVDLMKQADANMDQTARMKQYNQAEQQVVNDVAWIPMYQMENLKVVKPCVQNYPYDAQFVPAPDSWANIYISNNPICTSANAAG